MFQLLATKRDAQFIRNNTLRAKKEAESKEKQAIKEENLRQQNEAFKMFNELDSNKNQKYS